MIFLILTLFVFSMDLYLKNQIEQADQSEFPKTLLENRLILTRTHNKGMFMNLLDKHPLLTKVLPGGACLLVLCFYIPLLFEKGRLLLKLGLSLLAGGALSNLADHLIRGYVVDYIYVPWKFLKKIIFNLADAAVFLGVLFCALSELFRKR